ncbi:MAG TPA: nuclear transport factor 2 family protein, partial [Candidatus Limnocylindria bacterium]|nr:nuclear transport factor 2 family protein [Candidatus Limnocylindria bacterium]
MDSLPQPVHAAADVSAVSQLVLSERESRDNGWWNRMADCFHPDARIRLSWIDGDADAFVKGSIDMARRGMMARHRVGPPMVRLNGERAVASLPAI